MIRKYYIDRMYLFSIVGNLAYIDLNLESDKDLEGWIEVNIPTSFGTVVRLLYCKTRLFRRVCGAIVELSRLIDESEILKAYSEIVQSIRKTIGKP